MNSRSRGKRRSRPTRGTAAIGRRLAKIYGVLISSHLASAPAVKRSVEALRQASETMSLLRGNSAKSFIAGLIGLTMIGATSAALAGDGGWNGRWNAPLAAGVLGGLAIGALANSHPQPAYAPPPPPVYVEDAPPVIRCHWIRQPLYDDEGEYAGSRHVRVCD